MITLQPLEVGTRARSASSPLLLLMGASVVQDHVIASVYCVISDIRKGTVIKLSSGMKVIASQSFKPMFSSQGSLKLTIVHSS